MSLTKVSSSMGGGLQFISSVTASSSATVDFLSSFSSTYDIYKVFMTAVTPSSDGDALWARYAIGGTAQSSAGDYRYATDGVRDGDGSATASIHGSNTDTKIRLNNSSGTATGESAYAEFTIYGVNDTDNHKVCNWHIGGPGSGGQARVMTGTGFYDASTTAVTGVQFLFASGNVASGEFYLYGVAKR